MALCAAITCAAASVLLAIHLLGTLGIIRDYAVRVGTASSWRAQRQFGIGVPSTRLTDTDRLALWVWGIFGTLWLLRLAAVPWGIGSAHCERLESRPVSSGRSSSWARWTALMRRFRRAAGCEGAFRCGARRS